MNIYSEIADELHQMTLPPTDLNLTSVYVGHVRHAAPTMF